MLEAGCKPVNDVTMDTGCGVFEQGLTVVKCDKMG